MRLVADPDGVVMVDWRGRLPGRGVWITPRRDVLDRLPKLAPRLAHLLQARVDVPALQDRIRVCALDAVRDGLGIAARAGALVLGRDVLERALADGRVEWLVLSEKAAERTQRAFAHGAEGDEDVPVTLVPWTTDELGHMVGRGLVAVVGVTSSNATIPLLRQLRRLADLG